MIWHADKRIKNSYHATNKNPKPGTSKNDTLIESSTIHWTIHTTTLHYPMDDMLANSATTSVGHSQCKQAHAKDKKGES